MNRLPFSRRDLLKGSAAVAAAAPAGVFASPVHAQAPEAQAITPTLIAAAKREGKLVWYTSTPIEQGQKIVEAFQKEYAGSAKGPDEWAAWKTKYLDCGDHAEYRKVVGL